MITRLITFSLIVTVWVTMMFFAGLIGRVAWEILLIGWRAIG